jgi:hypothetical protein
MCASPRHYFMERLPSVSDPTSSPMKFHGEKISKNESSINLFQRSDSDAFVDRMNIWNDDPKMKSKPHISDNPFVNDDIMEFGETPKSNRSNYFTRSNSNKNLFDSTSAVKNDSVVRVKPKPMFKTPSMRRLGMSFMNQKSSAMSPMANFGSSAESPRIKFGLKPRNSMDRTPKSNSRTPQNFTPIGRGANSPFFKLPGSNSPAAKKVRTKKWYKPPITRQTSGKTPKSKNGAKNEIDNLFNNDSFSLKLMSMNSIEESKTPRSANKKTNVVAKPVKAKANGKKKKKIRHDVIYKTILRECRRFYQEKLNHATGFITSKKVRKDEGMYASFETFNKQFLSLNGNFEENFYLAALVYPQDLNRNITMFLDKKYENVTEAIKKKYTTSVNRIHDTLYKYSHDKLDFFASIPQLSFLF